MVLYYYQYDLLVDKHARRRRHTPNFEIKTHYGQLQNIFVVRLPRATELDIDEPATLILAGIKSCVLTGKNSLGMPYYMDLGHYEVVDMTTVQCLIGRVPVGNKWGIIDRSGKLVQTYFVVDE
jgi:hypothetical protein